MAAKQLKGESCSCINNIHQPDKGLSLFFLDNTHSVQEVSELQSHCAALLLLERMGKQAREKPGPRSVDIYLDEDVKWERAAWPEC